MALTAGTRLGPYEIVAPLGAGGMGEVYRAKDRRLGRDVAVKILPAHLQDTPAARARFEREARAVAALSHPNVLAIFELGTDRGIAFAVTELLVGQSLRQRLEHGPLAVRKVIDYASQVAKGLAAAHEHGIIHRDLKPENVFVTHDGIVKLLDFGLARHERARDAHGALTVSALFHSEPGVVLGTVGYMSPEQVRGEPADARSDIFSLGALLYELLTGEPAFRRTTAAETMTAVLKEEPGEIKTATVSGIGTTLDRIVRRCLEKRPEDRFQSARDLAFHLENLVQGSAVEMPPLAPAARFARRPRVVTVGLACTLAGLLGGVALQRCAGPASATGALQVRRLTFSGYDSEPSVSPDGSIVAFTSYRDGTPRIWVKQIAGGTEAARTAGPDWRPRFAPDGTAILFTHAVGDLASRRDNEHVTSVYQVSAVGGAARRMVENASEADWSPDGQRVVFVRSRVVGDQRASLVGTVDAKGGSERILAEFEGWDLYGVRWCLDGRRIAVMRAPSRGSSTQLTELVLVDAGTGESRVVELPNPRGPLSFPAWVAPGDDLVFALSGNTAATSDVAGALSRVVLRDSRGAMRTLFWAPNLFTMLGGAKDYARFDVAGPGTLVFDEIEQEQHLREVALGPAPGDRQDRVLTNGRSRDRQPTYSPDGKWVVFSSNRSGNLDLWKLNLATRELTQITDDAAYDWDPAFTRDGRIIWSSDRGGTLQVWAANADGTDERRITNDVVGAENPTATPDQRWIVYASDNTAADAVGIWRVRSDGTEARRLMSGTLFVPDVSPDGRYALAVEQRPSNREYRIRVVEIETAKVVPFQISIPFPLGAPNITWGRARWMSEGKAIAYVGLDEQGRSGVFVQDFVPDRDTAATRRAVAGFAREFVTESLGVAPDGTRIAISTLEQSRALMMATGLDGITRRSRFARP